MKWLFVILLLVGCANKASEAAQREAEQPKLFQVRCPLNTIESTTDTVKANSYYYQNTALNFYRKDVMFTYKQFPGTCVVKDISN